MSACRPLSLEAGLKSLCLLCILYTCAQDFKLDLFPFQRCFRASGDFYDNMLFHGAKWHMILSDLIKSNYP